MNKVSIVGTDMDFMSCYSMKKNFGHSEDMRNIVVVVGTILLYSGVELRHVMETQEIVIIGE